MTAYARAAWQDAFALGNYAVIGILFLMLTVGWGALAHGNKAASPYEIDLLVENAVLITVDDELPDSFRGYFTVGFDGRILDLGAGKAPPGLKVKRRLDVGGKIVAPGFISAHSHIYMSPLRGLGHDQNLYGWFEAWDRYLKHTHAEDIYWFTLHGALDFLRNGITTAYDFTYPGVVETVAIGADEAVPTPLQKPGPWEENQVLAKIDAGLRFIDSVSLTEIGTDQDIKQRFDEFLSWLEPYRSDPRFLGLALSGQVQFMPTRRTAMLEARFMREYGLLNQSHFLESPERVAEQQEKFSWYVDVGAVGPQMIFGHFIHVTDEIVDSVAASGASMSWQPTSNGRLADGIADIVRYREAGIPVAVGLDDQSCTDISDPYQNMRIGLYTMRGLHKSAQALSARDMLRLHTLGSAEVLNIDEDVGSLSVGKYADFLIVDLRDPDTGPVYEPLASYVLATGLRNLQQVYVGGELIVHGTELVAADESRVRAEIDARTTRIRHIADGL